MKNRHWMIGVMCWGAVGLMSGQVRLLRMDEMFQLADRNSKSINLHALAVDEAEQAVRVARNGQLPTIQAAMEFKYIGDGCMTDRDFTNGIHADMPHYGNSFVVKASQVVYAGGKISRSIEQAELNRQVSELEYRKNRQDVRFLLLGHYLDLYQLHNQQVVYQKNIEQTRLLVKDMQAAYRQGTALKSDITRYELQLQNLELGLTSTLNQIDVLNHRLVTTLGLEPGVHLVPDTTACGSCLWMPSRKDSGSRRQNRLRRCRLQVCRWNWEKTASSLSVLNGGLTSVWWRQMILLAPSW